MQPKVRYGLLRPVLRHRRGESAGPPRPPGLAGGPGARARRLARFGDLSLERFLPGEIRGHRRHRDLPSSAPPEGRGTLAYFREYAAALFHEFRLLVKVHRERGFSIIQACNPPDLIFLVAAPFKLLGTRFIFDQHDVTPELYVAKYEKKGFLYRALQLFE